MNILVPRLQCITDIINYDDCIIMVGPVPAGLPERYSVIMIDRETGQTYVIGRELEFQHAMTIAENTNLRKYNKGLYGNYTY